MNIEYPKELWFVKFKKGASFKDNLYFNLVGIRTKMELLNELKIRYGKEYSISAELIIQETIKGTGWKIVNTKLNKDAKDLKGKKFKIDIVETIIRKPDALWKPNE